MTRHWHIGSPEKYNIHHNQLNDIITSHLPIKNKELMPIKYQYYEFYYTAHAISQAIMKLIIYLISCLLLSPGK